ncbi:MAG: membrane protein insertase YidC [Anaerolineales bacterium]|nr:membrane protein insertase YidC [Anaerolineales bacterium]MCB8954631.1 membrane protein insertase YidC [Ardenticatenales bacterium]
MFDTVIINPMINALLWLYDFLGNNFFLAIAVFTIVIRLATLPTQIRQQRTSMKMQALQPRIQEIQKKYRDNPQKMQEEFKRIGYNPAESLAGCLPLLLQMPILIGLYRAILIILGSTPQSLLELTGRVYGGVNLASLLPITNKVGWLNLAQPDPLLILPALVFISSYFSQKVLTPAQSAADKNKSKKQQQEENPMAGMTQSMQYTMPIMFGVMSLQFPAGLSIYWILTSLIGVAMGYYARRQMAASPAPTPVAAFQEPAPTPQEMPKSKPEAPPARASKSSGSQAKRKRRSAKK